MQENLIEVILPSNKPLQPLQETQVLVEGAEPQKFYYLEGLFLEGEVKNQNGRIYPRAEIENAVRKINETIDLRGPIPGECDHPEETMHINFDRLAVAILSMRMEGNNGYGKMRVVPEGLGKIVEGAISAGIQVGVSSRGTGSVDSQNRVYDFNIVTVDAVLNPSAPNAFPNATLAESLKRYKETNETMSLIECAKYDANAQKHLENSLNKLFTELRDDVLWRK